MPGLRITTKLRLLNLLIVVGFCLILSITLVSYVILRNLSLDVANRETQKIISGSQITRHLSEILYETDHLAIIFYGQPDLLQRDGKRLTTAVEKLILATDNPSLKDSFSDLAGRIESLLYQCSVVNNVLDERARIDIEIGEGLQIVEKRIGDQLIQATLAGDDTSFAEQLLALVVSYKESLLEISLQISRLHGKMAYDHYFLHREDETCPIATALDDLFLRVQTITASGPEIARQGNNIAGKIRKYREIAVRLHVEMTALNKRKDELHESKQQAMLAIQNIEKEIAGSTRLTSEQIKKIIFISGLTVTLLSAVVIVIVYLTNTYLVKTSINDPMSAILSGIKSLGHGHLTTPISLDRKDEWCDIEQGLNTMASDLLDSYRSLQTSEERFRELADLLPQPVFETDSEGKLTYSNQKGFEIFGYQKEQLAAGLPAIELFAEENRAKAGRAIQTILTEKKPVEAHELAALTGDGRTISALIYMAPIFQEGRVSGARGIVVDISELRRIEQALVENERFLDSIVENIPDMIFVKNAEDLRFVRFNKAGEELLGFSKKELIGKNDYDFFPREEADFFTGKDQEVLQSRQQCDIPEERVQTRYKGIRTVHTKKIPVLDDSGNPLYLLGISEDITDQLREKEEKRQLEKELLLAQKMKTIGLMAGGVAHDLNNILAGIVGYPELLLEDLPEDSELRGPIEGIREAGERAVTVVADLLTVSRGAASEKETRNLHVLIGEYFDSPEYLQLKSLFPFIGYQMQLKAARSHILCSPVHIKKCLMNLVTNAAEAIEGGGVITIATSNRQDDAQGDGREVDPGDYVVLTIRDTGSGISKADMEHIFDPFYSRKVMGRSGSGLGLTVVWNTVQNHDGKIFVESSEQGTCFTLYFPVSPEGKSLEPQQVGEEDLAGNGEHILVVDDEPQLRDLAARMLQTLGYRVDAVSSGEEAIRFVREHPVDLILMDMLMEPGINGRRTYEEIIRLYPGQKAVVASGFSESDDVKAALQLGAGGFIKKPYTKVQLGRAVKRVLTV